jgi:hypothetical protein
MLKLYIESTAKGKQEVELPEDFLNLILEIGGQRLYLAEKNDEPALLRILSYTGLLAVHPKNISAILVECRPR